MLPRAIQTGLDEQSANALPLGIGGYREALKFGQFLRVNVDGREADDPTVLLRDETVSGQFAEFINGSAEQDAPLNIRFDQHLDGFGVRKLSGADGDRVPCRVHPRRPLFWAFSILAHVSRKETVRFSASESGRESLASTQK